MENSTTVTPEEQGDGFNKILAVLIAVVTLLIAVITFLQSDAGNRDDMANRDTKSYSLEAFGKQVSGDARVNYDYNSAYQAYYELDLLAASAAAVEDDAAAARYEMLRDRILELSPLLSPEYFDVETGELNVSKYEADVYLVETTGLMERFYAASDVKNGWDYKANTYIIHLTMLAVTLFLYGMATTVKTQRIKVLFTTVGSAVALVAVVWAVVLFAKPVKDLRQCMTDDGTPAIDAYAQGVGLAYQDLYEEAIVQFDAALACEPKYVNALRERADAYASLGDWEASSADYLAAQEFGDKTSNTAGNLAWNYYLMGNFEDAIAMNQQALEKDPDELWIRYDLALAYLANGDIDAARAEYQKGIDSAAKQVAEAREAGKEPPSFLWWGLEDAAMQLDNLTVILDYGEGEPSPDLISDPDVVYDTALELITGLKNTSVSLEYDGVLPEGELTASVSEFTFAMPVVDEDGEVVDYEVSDVFEYGTDEVSVLFDYEGMSDGQEVIFKVYIDGEEDPSWRIVDEWSLGESGTAEKPISFAYSNVAVLDPGEYTVEMYVDAHLAARGFFYIEE